HVDGRAPQVGLVCSAALDDPAEDVVAEVLDQKQPCIEILRDNLWRGQTRGPQCAGHGYPGAQVLGKVSDAAVWLAIPDRRAVRLARSVHQHDTVAVAGHAAEAPGGGVSLEVEQPCVGPAR